MNYMLVESPNLVGKPIPCIDTLVGSSSGSRRWLPALYSFNDVPPIHVLYEPAPRCLEILLDIVRDLYRGILSDPTSSEMALTCFLDFENFSDPRLAPKTFQRQNWIIAARWTHWERNRMTLAERAVDLERVGVSFNARDADKNRDALKHRLQRMGLKPGTP